MVQQNMSREDNYQDLGHNHVGDVHEVGKKYGDQTQGRSRAMEEYARMLFRHTQLQFIKAHCSPVGTEQDSRHGSLSSVDSTD